MKRAALLLLVPMMGVPYLAHAEVCLDPDNQPVPCPPTSHQTQGAWQSGTFPKFAGITADIYISGGKSVDPLSGFGIYANNQFLCSTGNDTGNTTPIRHCKATIQTPGTYTLSARPLYQGQNFLAPQDAIINVD
ncbi:MULTISPECIES: hypothetical protein [Pseudoxanthomonas]|jgi:hypothetical protein|uniref:Uncharacterized protein n=1 Tax=Pseudoxanthomonas winnipegensis TaxID=2480810 RepID=A0A4Q8LEF0_9GAMM|nr:MULTISPECIES: hypothetical protein [Pseudoxanthomonas]PZP62618.1 MAG: hypothetical protein DI597_07090 [Pseudoxanthomonas spadix]TAA26970.1 hypothetical protein EA660_07110 [Pseudoxanthomonas winnipegensis]TMN23992.1 hypothetical protein FF950_06985 [Pseudoxanthomonas sp. X-1]UAY75617.1 hypothetical protein LAJ50_05010 [Pseudoxanthomonas sp. X-1]